MDRIKKLKIKKQDGTFSDYIPIGADAENIDTTDGESVQLKLNKKPYYYNSVADMKADRSLKQGDMAVTLGYYSVNDGGNASYRIVNNTSTTDFQETLGNGKYANLVIENNTINIKQLGGKSYQMNNNNLYDNKYIIDNIMSKIENSKIKLELFLPNGWWSFSPTLINTEVGIKIQGQKSYLYYNNEDVRIIPYQNNQDYILKIGGNESFTVTNKVTNGIEIDGVIFSGQYSNDSKKWWKVNKGLLCLDFCLYSFFGELCFMKFEGTGLYIRSCWEDTFDYLSFRTKTNPEYPCINIAKAIPFVSGANVSAMEFGKMFFEGCDGDYILSEQGSSFNHSHIGSINIECTVGTRDERRGNISSSEDVSTYKKCGMFKGQVEFLQIDSINFLYQNNFKLTWDNNVYYFAALFINDVENSTDLGYQTIQVGNIMFQITNNDNTTKILYSKNSPSRSAFLQIANLFSPSLPNSGKRLLFDCTYSSQVQIGNLSDFYNRKLCNATPFYKIAINNNNRGLICTDENSLNDLYLILKKPRESLITGDISVLNAKCYYPYDKNSTAKISVRLKAPLNESYSLLIRGTLNGSIVNYTISGTGTGEYEIKSIDVIFDNGEISFLETVATANLYLDYFTYGAISYSN